MSDLEDLQGSVGDKQIVWEVLFAYDHQVRVDDGSGSGDTNHSHYDRKRRTVHIIAPTLELVKAGFAHHYPARVSNYEAVSFTPLCTINHVIDEGNHL